MCFPTKPAMLRLTRVKVVLFRATQPKEKCVLLFSIGAIYVLTDSINFSIFLLKKNVFDCV